LRIESIKSTTAKAREKIVAAEPHETDDPAPQRMRRQRE
jgi:hypothetical protein